MIWQVFCASIKLFIRASMLVAMLAIFINFTYFLNTSSVPVTLAWNIFVTDV